MVKNLSASDLAVLHEAVDAAEKQSHAKIDIAIVQSSDAYRDFVLFYGFTLGTAISLGLWISNTLTYFPWLLAIQLSTILLIDLIPWLRRLCVRLVPRRIRHARCALVAMQNYHARDEHIEKGKLFVLLFVSMAERYVHVVTNPAVHKQVPSGWNAVTDHFSRTVRSKGLRAASIKAIRKIGEMLN